MAKNNSKTVKVKFLADTAFAGKIHREGAVLDVSEDDALALIDGKHAAEAKETAPE